MGNIARRSFGGPLWGQTLGPSLALPSGPFGDQDPFGDQEPGWEGRVRGLPFAADLTPHHPIPNSQFQLFCFWRGVSEFHFQGGGGQNMEFAVGGSNTL